MDMVIFELKWEVYMFLYCRMMVINDPSVSAVLLTSRLSSDLSVGETSQWRQQWTVSL